MSGAAQRTLAGLGARWATPSHPTPLRLCTHTPLALLSPHTVGIGGDNSDGASGLFFEGIMLKGASTEAADTAVQADITAFYAGVTLV